MTADAPSLIDDLNPWVATAPQPLLAITGHTAVIAEVRFVWHGMHCSWCRQQVALWTDGGTIDAGLALGRPRRRSPATGAHWYQTYRPSGVPAVPGDCPHPNCRRSATRTLSTGEQVPTGWLDGTWRLDPGPFTLGPRTDERCPHPAHPTTNRLLNEVWSTLRRTHPDLATAADAYDAERRRRDQRG
ncbi:hypothetical protein [Actinoplanes sp. NPDC089786]|uniref:hypothetical protein n=1 Tax=Actinoplanes sp. NPDC089786 TaxID=3155185 RepID=UPI003413BB9D